MHIEFHNKVNPELVLRPDNTHEALRLGQMGDRLATKEILRNDQTLLSLMAVLYSTWKERGKG